MKNFKALMICVGLAVALPALAAEQATSVYRGKTEMEGAPEVLSGSSLVEATLTIEDVDKSNRLIALKGPAGRMVTVHADARVKNFDQLKKGDQVAVAYYEGVTIDVVPPGQEGPKPSIAKVNGHALAGGLGLMLSCDLAVAAEHAEFGTPEIDVGLFPVMIMAVLARLVPRRALVEMTEHAKRGCDIVYTPHIAKIDLWKTSGHLEFYRDYLFPPMEIEGQQYMLKPMNCLGHILIYKSQLHSYRNLPLRYAELARYTDTSEPAYYMVWLGLGDSLRTMLTFSVDLIKLKAK